MSKNSNSSHNNIAEVTVRYLDDDYQKIVKPNRLFLIPNYFIEYWLNRLGPTLAWIVVSLQQASWRANSDCCTIAQAAIAEEIGLHRHTVARELTRNKWRPWHIPHVIYQPGVTDKEGIYHGSPNRYEIYDPTPLIPEHLAGLYGYIQSACPGYHGADIQSALAELLNIKAGEALALLEAQARESDRKIERPLSVKNVVEMATGLRLEALSRPGGQELKQQCSRLEVHLADIGKTICRQYFRLAWAPRLGPSLAWLVTILRSRCYYNKDTGELRDIYTWQKKDLVALLGQSTKNLKNLLSHKYTAHFIQILAQNKRKLTLRVAIVEEPLITESADQFWSRQPQNWKNFDMTSSRIGKNLTRSPLESEKIRHDPPPESEKIRHDPPLESEKIRHDPPSNRKKFDMTPPRIGKISTYISTINKVLTNDEIHDSIQNDVVVENSENELKKILSAAGLSGLGLDDLCRRQPPLDRQNVRAVLLYAEARGLGPGYIYRHLASEAAIDDLFLEFAALDDETLSLFRQAVSELKAGGSLIPEIETPIPDDQLDCFARFAQAFSGLEAGAVLAALRRGEENPHARRPISRPGGQSRGEANDLDLLWDQVLSQLRLQMAQETFDAWVRDTRLVTRAGRQFTVAVKSAFAKDWLENRLCTTIQRALAGIIKVGDEQGASEVDIDFIVDSSV